MQAENSIYWELTTKTQKGKQNTSKCLTFGQAINSGSRAFDHGDSNIRVFRCEPQLDGSVKKVIVAEQKEGTREITIL